MKLLEDLRKRTQNRREQFLLALVKEAIKIPAVQHAIADEFSSNTPMCRVLDQAVESRMDHVEVEADDVVHLESTVEGCIERYFNGNDFSLDAEQVNDLDDAIEKVVEEKMNDFVSNVMEEIARRINQG